MAENIASALKEAVLGSDQDEIIKAGTLTVTRGIGVIAVAFVGTFYLLDQFGDKGPWHGLTTPQKLTFVIAAALVWAIVASGDAIARGLATARQNDLVASLPTGLRATKTEGTDSAGWSVVAVKFSPGAGANGPEYLLVKAGQAASWLPAEKISFGSTVCSVRGRPLDYGTGAAHGITGVAEPRGLAARPGTRSAPFLPPAASADAPRVRLSRPRRPVLVWRHALGAVDDAPRHFAKV